MTTPKAKNETIDFLDLSYSEQYSWHCHVFAIDLPGHVQDALQTLGQPSYAIATLSGDVSVDGTPGYQPDAILDVDSDCVVSFGDTHVNVAWADLPKELTRPLAEALYAAFDWEDWCSTAVDAAMSRFDDHDPD